MSESSCSARLFTMINCSRLRCFFLLIIGAIFFLLFIVSSLGPSPSLSVEPNSTVAYRRITSDGGRTWQSRHLDSLDQWEDSSGASSFVYDPDHDVLVFLHMQKTSGSVFGRHLIHDAVGFPAACRRIRGRKRHNCTDSRGYEWLFSRHSTGWACGLHADWTELRPCVHRALNRIEGVRRQRRYVYFTFLRDPIYRYLSEFKHVQRGATWKNVKLKCNGESAAGTLVPHCYTGKSNKNLVEHFVDIGENWAGVSLDAFMACPYNLANNRQTRMLADLTLVGCYNLSAFPDATERDRIMLQSAMNNLRSMVFYGLTERQVDSQHLFEDLFGVHFVEDFVQRNSTNADRVDVTDDQMRNIESLNHLDVRLYRFALQLFDERVRESQQRSSSARHETSNQGQITGHSGLGRRLVNLAND